MIIFWDFWWEKGTFSGGNPEGRSDCFLGFRMETSDPGGTTKGEQGQYYWHFRERAK